LINNEMEEAMNSRSIPLRHAVSGLTLATCLLVAGGTAFATEQGEQRRAARDTRQDSRQDSRTEKVDCRAADQKNNAQCRQDKRNTKQDGRQEARDIKY